MLTNREVKVQFSVASQQAQAALEQLSRVFSQVETSGTGAASGMARAGASVGQAATATGGWSASLTDVAGKWGMLALGWNQIVALGSQVVGSITRISDSLDKRADMMAAARADIAGLTDATKNLVSTNDLLAASNRLMNAEFNVGQENMNLFARAAWNLAQRSGQSWQSAMDAIAAAVQGSTRGLRQFGIVLKEGTAPTERMHTVVEALRGVASSAAVEASSFAEQIEALNNASKNAAAGGLSQMALAINALLGDVPRRTLEDATQALQRQAERWGAMGREAELRRELADIAPAGAILEPGSFEFERSRAIRREMERLARAREDVEKQREAALAQGAVREAEEAAADLAEEARYDRASAMIDGLLERRKQAAAAAMRLLEQEAEAATQTQRTIADEAMKTQESIAQSTQRRLAEELIELREGAALQREMRLEEETRWRARIEGAREVDRRMREGRQAPGPLDVGLGGFASGAAIYDAAAAAADRLGHSQAWVNEQLGEYAGLLDESAQKGQAMAGTIASAMGFAEGAINAALQGAGAFGKYIVQALAGMLKTLGLRMIGQGIADYATATAMAAVPWLMPFAPALFAAASKEMAIGAMMTAGGLGIGLGAGAIGGGGGGAGGVGGRSPGVGAGVSGGGEITNITVYVNGVVTDAAATGQQIVETIRAARRGGRVQTVETGGHMTLALD